MLQAQGQIFDRHAIKFTICYSDNDKSVTPDIKNAVRNDKSRNSDIKNRLRKDGVSDRAPDNEAGSQSDYNSDNRGQHGIKRQHESAHGNVHVVEALVKSDYLHWMNLRFLLRMFRRR